MASNERRRELTLLGEPGMQAWVERAANRMVGDLLSEGRFDEGPQAAPAEDDFAFADRLIRCELGLIADGAYPLRVALRVAVLRTAREVLLAHASIRALPEVGMVAALPPQHVFRDARGSRHGC